MSVHVESEQIIELGHSLVSFVAVRGSVPVLLKGDCKPVKSLSLSEGGFKKHFEYLNMNYG